MVWQALVDAAYENWLLLERGREGYTYLQQVLAYLKATLAHIHPSLAQSELAHGSVHVMG